MFHKSFTFKNANEIEMACSNFTLTILFFELKSLHFAMFYKSFSLGFYRYVEGTAVASIASTLKEVVENAKDTSKVLAEMNGKIRRVYKAIEKLTERIAQRRLLDNMVDSSHS